MTVSLDQGAGSAKTYSAAIDYLRFAAAVIVVLFHTGTMPSGSDVIAVGFFAIGTTFFGLQSLQASQTGLGPYTRRRMRRLLYPFFVWALLHAVLKAASTGFNLAALPDEFEGWLPPDGSFAQLWFMLWAFTATVSLAIVFRSRDATLVDPRRALAATFAAAVAASLLLWFYTSAELTFFIKLFVLYAVSAVAGLLIFSLRTMYGRLWFATAIMVATGLVLQSFSIQGTEQLTIALPVFVLALQVPLADAPLPRFLGLLSLDVYLCHMLVIVFCQNLGGVSVNTLSGALTALFLSILVALAIRSTFFGKWMV